MYDMYNKLPYFVYIKDEKYFIRTDYRIFKYFEEEMQGRNIKEAIYKCLQRFYPAFSKIMQNNLLNEAIDNFLWFYKCGKEDIETSSKKKSINKKSIFSYKYDDQLIWGAYFSQFKVDLSTINLHWWKFKAMWVSLDSECQFSKIRGYRAYNGKDKELLRLKEEYDLPPTELEVDDRLRRKKIFDELNKIKAS